MSFVRMYYECDMSCRGGSFTCLPLLLQLNQLLLTAHHNPSVQEAPATVSGHPKINSNAKNLAVRLVQLRTLNATFFGSKNFSRTKWKLSLSFNLNNSIEIRKWNQINDLYSNRKCQRTINK